MKSCVMGDDAACCCWKNDDGCCLKMGGCFDNNSAEDGGRDNSGDDTVKAVALFAVAVRPIRRRVNLMVMIIITSTWAHIQGAFTHNPFLGVC